MKQLTRLMYDLTFSRVIRIVVVYCIAHAILNPVQELICFQLFFNKNLLLHKINQQTIIL